MAVAFWSIKLNSNGEKVKVQPPEGFVLTITMVALDTTDVENNASFTVKLATQSIEGSDIDSIIGTLKGNGTTQFSTNIVIGYDVETEFSVGSKSSKGVVHLSGYYQPAPNDGKYL